MADVEKVIQRIEEEISLGEYWDECYRMIDLLLLRDTITLLKEREPVRIEIEGGGNSWWHVCEECHGAVDQSDHFCKHCGRPFQFVKGAEKNGK